MVVGVDTITGGAEIPDSPADELSSVEETLTELKEKVELMGSDLSTKKIISKKPTYWFSMYLRCEVRAFEGGVKTAEEDDEGVGLPSLPPATPPPVCTIGLSVSKSMRSCPAPLPVEEEEEAVLLGCLRIPPEVSEALPRLTPEPAPGWTPP